jgi:hypothetical protein
METVGAEFKQTLSVSAALAPGAYFSLIKHSRAISKQMQPER